jgi:hypothetical protein
MIPNQLFKEYFQFIFSFKKSLKYAHFRHKVDKHLNTNIDQSNIYYISINCNNHCQIPQGHRGLKYKTNQYHQSECRDA